MHQNACGAARKVNPPKQKQACMAGLFLILYQSGRSIGGGALEGELCLLAVGGILMDDAFACRFIHGAHSLQKRCFSGCRIPCRQRLIIPLDGGLDRRSHHTVAQILLRSNADPFLGGFDVCQMIHPLSYRCLFGCPTKAKPFARTNEIIPCSFALCKTFLSRNPAEIRRPAGCAAMSSFFCAHPRHSGWNMLAGMRKWIYDNANGSTPRVTAQPVAYAMRLYGELPNAAPMKNAIRPASTAAAQADAYFMFRRPNSVVEL